jgi:hypothetical protein
MFHPDTQRVLTQIAHHDDMNLLQRLDCHAASSPCHMSVGNVGSNIMPPSEIPIIICRGSRGKTKWEVEREVYIVPPIIGHLGFIML